MLQIETIKRLNLRFSEVLSAGLRMEFRSVSIESDFSVTPYHKFALFKEQVVVTGLFSSKLFRMSC
jgi:hypothetical protein